MARKRHGGLGRGLDALIPQARPRQVPQQENPEGKEQAAGSGQDPEKKAQVAAPGPENGKENTDAARVIPEAEKKAEPAATAVSADPAGTEKTENTGEADRTGETAERSENAKGPSGAVPVSGLTEAAGPTEASGLSGAVTSVSEGAFNLSDAADLREEAGSGIRVLRLSQVDPNRSQPRQNFEDEALEELAESIRQFGVLQPILVQKKGSRYEIIAGERRWRASRKAGLKEIPAIVKEYSDQETLELSLIENIQRQDLNPIEEAKAFRRLLDEFGLRQEDLAVRVSKSRTAITNAVRLLKLDERVQDLLIRDQISMGHARALLPVEIPDEQFLLAQQVADKHLSVREVEKLVKTRLAGKAARKAKDGKKAVEKDPALELAYRTIEEQLKQSLGTRAVIRGGGDGTGRIEIDFYSNEDLEKIVDLLT